MLNVQNSIGRDSETHLSTPDPQGVPCWYANTISSDYFNLLALNEAGEAMILEDLTAISAWGSWHLVSGLLKNGENPITAAQNKLLALTGYNSHNWVYLGSFMLNARQPDVTGHFFSAHNVKWVMPPCTTYQQRCAIKWTPPNELKYALLDGRIGMMSYAVAASLALLLFPTPP